ncbi:MAG: ABC transporter substrate-binding protein, partial [Candidatus Rokubacteria bacterium]|nr:ABC transporter substrate-binding protein [Candidatus Rokubacteria bacterium]
MWRPGRPGYAASILGAALLLALAPPPAARDAQPSTRTVRIGHLALAPPTARTAPIREAFVQQLGALGWTQGRNLVLESRDAGGRPERLAELAMELVRLRSDVIVASGVSSVLAARRATSTIPIVMAGASDPVAFGLVQSLAHPGANITGLSDTPGREIEGKRLEILREMVPRVSRVAVVLDSTARRDPGPTLDAARALRLTLLVSRETADPEEFRQTFAALGVPGCVQCHSNHDVERTSEAMLAPGPRSVCMTC